MPRRSTTTTSTRGNRTTNAGKVRVNDPETGKMRYVTPVEAAQIEARAAATAQIAAGNVVEPAMAAVLTTIPASSALPPDPVNDPARYDDEIAALETMKAEQRRNLMATSDPQLKLRVANALTNADNLQGLLRQAREVPSGTVIFADHRNPSARVTIKGYGAVRFSRGKLTTSDPVVINYMRTGYKQAHPHLRELRDPDLIGFVDKRSSGDFMGWLHPEDASDMLAQGLVRPLR